ncbi:hypothetical protein C8R45DRAFT_1086424 [Mycena sanguinolenta]|nr:hypothetical protein C8R45DRAFT_1086424 [Mycena sanguinolenta]
MSKRKQLVSVDEDDFNDGSDSDDSAVGYAPRSSAPRMHSVPDESTTIPTTGRTRTIRSTVPVPASPAKKSKVQLNAAIAPAMAVNLEQRVDWSSEFQEFDAEYGPGIDAGPRALRDSDDPSGQWAREHREEFLDEILRHDGRGDYATQIVLPLL